MPKTDKGRRAHLHAYQTRLNSLTTTTDSSSAVAESLADLSINISEYAAEMFAAKSDVGAFSGQRTLRMWTAGTVGDTKFRFQFLKQRLKVILDRRQHHGDDACCCREDGI
jgi:manganese-dependent inorganic pyrophosphatase